MSCVGDYRNERGFIANKMAALIKKEKITAIALILLLILQTEFFKNINFLRM